MAKKSKAMEQIRALAEANNLKILEVYQTKHIRIKVERPDGTQGMMTYPVSPRCPRTDKAQKMQWRHFALGINLKGRSQKD